jgi:hypothetical protein
MNKFLLCISILTICFDFYSQSDIVWEGNGNNGKKTTFTKINDVDWIENDEVDSYYYSQIKVENNGYMLSDKFRQGVYIYLNSNECFYKDNNTDWILIYNGTWKKNTPKVNNSSNDITSSQSQNLIPENCESARKEYLDKNPDVKNAGMDPWTHYNYYGKNEGRVWPACKNKEIKGFDNVITSDDIKILTGVNDAIVNGYLVPKDEQELTQAYNAILDKKEKINYLKFVIEKYSASDENSLTISSVAYFYKIKDQSLYFNNDEFVSKDEWMTNYKFLSLWPSDLHKGDNPMTRALFLYSCIVTGVKSNNDISQYADHLLNEFSAENCPLGSEFYQECRKYRASSNTNTSAQSNDVELRNAINSFIFGAFKEGVNQGINNWEKVYKGDGCYSCMASGNCKTCSKDQNKYYFPSGNCSYYHWERKIGYVVCSNCRGSNFTLEKGNLCNCSNFCKGVPCNSNSCNNGWVPCPDCNSGMPGTQIGKCKYCKGTGKAN